MGVILRRTPRFQLISLIGFYVKHGETDSSNGVGERFNDFNNLTNTFNCWSGLITTLFKW